MKSSLIVFTLLVLFNFQALSIDAPTTGDFALIYPMMEGLAEGYVQWYISQPESIIPQDVLMGRIMYDVNYTLYCVQYNEGIRNAASAFRNLFAYSSMAIPFDIRNFSPGIESYTIFNILNLSLTPIYPCRGLENNYIGALIANLYHNTNQSTVFDMIYAFLLNHTEAVNEMGNQIKNSYLMQNYKEMGKMMFRLFKHAMHLVPYYFPPPLPNPGEAPTSGDFELFYPMFHGFVRGLVEWMIAENHTALPSDQLIREIMVQVNSTLSCIQSNPQLHSVYVQFTNLFAYVSLAQPFDIRNISPGTSSSDISNMIINAYSVASACMTSLPIGPKIANLIGNTTSYYVFEMIYGLSVNHTATANTYLNFIIPYYFNRAYGDMGYYIFKLVILAMKSVPYYFPPNPTPPPTPPPPPVPTSVNVSIPIVNMVNKTIVSKIKIVANLSSSTKVYLGSIYFKDTLPSYPKYPMNVYYIVSIPKEVKKIKVASVSFTIYSYSSSNAALQRTAYFYTMPKLSY